MAGDWIKMRVWLRRDPCVATMADFLASKRAFMDSVTDPVRVTCKESVYEHITSDVTRAITVISLLEVWGVARDRGDRDGDDLVLKHCALTALDDICGVPCFGEAMEAVDWAIEEEVSDARGRLVFRVRFPNFFRDQQSPEDRYKKQHAEAQARYRNRQNQDGKSDVTRDVTVTPREEKRREELKEGKNTLSGKPDDVPPAEPPVDNTTAREVLAYLNQRVGKSFKPLEVNLKLVRARLGDGATVEELKAVINAKAKEWADDKEMSRFLRPATLFGREKFAQYSGQLPAAEPDWWTPAGFRNRWEAENVACYRHTAKNFRDGKPIPVAA